MTNQIQKKKTKAKESTKKLVFKITGDQNFYLKKKIGTKYI